MTSLHDCIKSTDFSFKLSWYNALSEYSSAINFPNNCSKLKPACSYVLDFVLGDSVRLKYQRSGIGCQVEGVNYDSVSVRAKITGIDSSYSRV